MAKVKLHRCPIPTLGLRGGIHSCQKVEKALKQQGIDYEVVHVPILPRSKRTWVIEKTGQDRVPVIEFADGSVYRDESADMAKKIEAGKLFEGKPRSASRFFRVGNLAALAIQLSSRGRGRAGSCRRPARHPRELRRSLRG